MQLDEGGEGGVDLAFGAGLQDMELHPLRARRFLHVSDRCARHSDCSGSRAGRSRRPGEPARKAARAAWASARRLRMLTPVRLPPGRARLATRPVLDRVAAAEKTIGIVEVALFAASAEGVPPGRDHVDLAADEIGGQCGQPIIAALRPAVFDRHVLSLDVAGFAQSLAERGHKRCNGRARCCRGSRSPASPSAARAAARAAITAPPSRSSNSRRFITR